MTLLRSMPILLCRNVRSAAAFWEGLGFENHGFWGEEATLFCIMQRGEVTLGLNTAPERHAPWPAGYWAAYLYVTNVDALYREFAAKNPPEITEPRDQPYGCRDFEIRDPDGYRIAFGQDMVSASDAPPGLATDEGRA